MQGVPFKEIYCQDWLDTTKITFPIPALMNYLNFITIIILEKDIQL